MSQDIARIIPQNHLDRCPSELLTRAMEFVESQLPSRNGVNLVHGDEVLFFDPGELLTSIKCDHCGEEIPIPWWQDVMSKASESTFQDLSIKTPCCSSTTSLNQLIYCPRAGFATWAIEIRDLISGNIPGEFLNACEAKLGRPIVLMWARY